MEGKKKKPNETIGQDDRSGSFREFLALVSLFYGEAVWISVHLRSRGTYVPLLFSLKI